MVTVPLLALHIIFLEFLKTRTKIVIKAIVDIKINTPTAITIFLTFLFCLL